MIGQIKQQLNQQSTPKPPQTEGDLNYNSEKEPSVSPLTDADYEFLFNQLLEGVAHGWHSLKIAKFFQRLAERGQQELWVAWLKRYQTKIIGSSDLYQQQLGARMIRLGEISQSISSIQQIGNTSYSIGKKILYGINPDLIWEYDGADLPAVAEAETVQPQADVEDDAPTVAQNTSPPNSSSFAEAANWIQEAIAEFVELAEKVADEAAIEESETENNREDRSSSATAELSQPSEPQNQELSAVNAGESHEEENLVKKEPDLVKKTQTEKPILAEESVINLSWQQFIELIEEDEHLVEQIAKQFNLTDKDPKSIIKAVTSQLNSDESELVDESTLKLVESWFNLGLKQVRAGDLNEAIISWEKALELNPNLAEAWHNRGSALGRLGNYEEALESFAQALKIAPDNAPAWNEHAHALYQLQQWQRAVASWDRAIALVSSNYQFWYNRGCALEQLQKYQEAIASYEKALEIKPDFQWARSRYTTLLGRKHSIN